MNIAELRELLERTSSTDMKRIVVEIYRTLPKKTRDQIGIDDLLQNPAGVATRAKPNKTEGRNIDLGVTESELDQFLTDAYAQNYLSPNRSVTKAQRPKWRFRVKSFFKEINASVAEPGNVEKAAGMLERLYNMLCYACDYILFSAYDPFESVGISQTEFFAAVLALKAQHLNLEKFIDEALRLVSDSSLNRYTLGSGLANAVVERLATPESLELAIARAARLYDEAFPQSGGKPSYKKEDKLNRMAEFGFLAYIKLADFDSAIDFLKARLVKSRPEIALYVILEWMRTMKRTDLWLREYERGVRSGINPRDGLQKVYMHLKEHNEFPAHF